MRGQWTSSHRPCDVLCREIAGGEVTRVCGHGGTFAIGVCAEFAKVVCGNNNGMLDGHRLCGTRRSRYGRVTTVLEAELLSVHLIIRSAGWAAVGR